MTEGFPIPAAIAQSEQVILRSRFISSLAPAPDADAARAFIAEIKELYDDASHNCWAFVAGVPGSTASVGCSDDGEPTGTAGQPMLKVLLHSGVGEIVAVVTRYFGGTKLGRGGLVRAYSGGVQAALEVLDTVRKVELVRLVLTLDYPMLDRFQRSGTRFEVQVEETEFSDRVQVQAVLPAYRRKEFVRWFTDLTHGRGEVQDRPRG